MQGTVISAMEKNTAKSLPLTSFYSKGSKIVTLMDLATVKGPILGGVDSDSLVAWNLVHPCLHCSSQTMGMLRSPRNHAVLHKAGSEKVG